MTGFMHVHTHTCACVRVTRFETTTNPTNPHLWSSYRTLLNENLSLTFAIEVYLITSML
jgi:hypothetical protein